MPTDVAQPVGYRPTVRFGAMRAWSVSPSDTESNPHGSRPRWFLALDVGMAAGCLQGCIGRPALVLRRPVGVTPSARWRTPSSTESSRWTRGSASESRPVQRRPSEGRPPRRWATSRPAILRDGLDAVVPELPRVARPGFAPPARACAKIMAGWPASPGPPPVSNRRSPAHRRRPRPRTHDLVRAPAATLGEPLPRTWGH
jgi:hypothetical protein